LDIQGAAECFHFWLFVCLVASGICVGGKEQTAILPLLERGLHVHRQKENKLAFTVPYVTEQPGISSPL
jgi:hypothetical protein